MVADAPGLGQEILEGGYLGTELVQPDGGGELVGELITLSIIQVVLVLFRRPRAGPATEPASWRAARG